MKMMRCGSENVQLRKEATALRAGLKNKDQSDLRYAQTIDHLQLADRAKTKRMEKLHDRIYELGVANRDLEAEI
jgi:hypothetical protein